MRGERELDAFGRARRDQHAIRRRGTPRAAKSAATASRAATNAGRGRVAVVPVAHRARDRLDEMRRREEPELVRIADVQIPHAPCRPPRPSCLGHDVADGVGEAVDALGGANAEAAVAARIYL